MKKEFGNVKGFDTAILFLSPIEKANLLELITSRETFEKESGSDFGESSMFSNAEFALAAIYFANNEDE